jgi:ABC-2 type transport system permease protein
MTSSLFGYSIALVRDREAGVFQRLRLTPTPTWQIMGSRLVLQVVADLVMTVIVIIVAYIVLLLLGLVGVSGVLGPAFRTIGGWSPVGALINIYGAAGGASWSSASTAGVIASVIYIVTGTYVGVRWFRWGLP